MGLRHGCPGSEIAGKKSTVAYSYGSSRNTIVVTFCRDVVFITWSNAIALLAGGDGDYGWLKGES